MNPRAAHLLPSLVPQRRQQHVPRAPASSTSFFYRCGCSKLLPCSHFTHKPLPFPSVCTWCPNESDNTHAQKVYSWFYLHHSRSPVLLMAAASSVFICESRCIQKKWCFLLEVKPVSHNAASDVRRFLLALRKLGTALFELLGQGSKPLPPMPQKGGMCSHLSCISPAPPIGLLSTVTNT